MQHIINNLIKIAQHEQMKKTAEGVPTGYLEGMAGAIPLATAGLGAALGGGLSRRIRPGSSPLSMAAAIGGGALGLLGGGALANSAVPNHGLSKGMGSLGGSLGALAGFPIGGPAGSVIGGALGSAAGGRAGHVIAADAYKEVMEKLKDPNLDDETKNSLMMYLAELDTELEGHKIRGDEQSALDMVLEMQKQGII